MKSKENKSENMQKNSVEKHKLTFEQECNLIANGEDLMKDKEKQIEEIAKEMSKELCCYYDKRKRKCSNCFGMEEDCDLHCNFGRTLERLSNAGYRKIDKDSVVLSREELEKIIDQTKETEKNYYKKVVIPQERKEATEKIMQDLKPLLEGFVHTDTGENLYVYKCKQFGVEIKE